MSKAVVHCARARVLSRTFFDVPSPMAFLVSFHVAPPACPKSFRFFFVLFFCSFFEAADEPQDPVVAQSAFMLYGMIHARFIVTARGLEAMVSSVTPYTQAD